MKTVLVAAANTLIRISRLPISSLFCCGQPLPRISTALPATPRMIPMIFARWIFSRISRADTLSVTIGAIVASVEASTGLVYLAPHSIRNSCP